MTATVVRYARMYWRLNELAWQQVRRAAVPLLVLFGAASLAIALVGTAHGHPELALAPAFFVGAMSVGVIVSRY